MSHQPLFSKMIGKWQGTCRTWFEPGQFADESPVTGEITALFGDHFLRHTYTGSMQDKPRHGEELIVFNTIGNQYETSWFDSFHMNSGILFSQGPPSDQGFAVRGNYDIGAPHPKWGWKTVYKLLEDNHLTITAYNIMPDSLEAKAVETVYLRLSERQP